MYVHHKPGGRFWKHRWSLAYVDFDLWFLDSMMV